MIPLKLTSWKLLRNTHPIKSLRYSNSSRGVSSPGRWSHPLLSFLRTFSDVLCRPEAITHIASNSDSATIYSERLSAWYRSSPSLLLYSCLNPLGDLKQGNYYRSPGVYFVCLPNLKMFPYLCPLTSSC